MTLKFTRQRAAGLTLLELIVAIAIVGILSNVAVGYYFSYLGKNDQNTAIRDIEIIELQIKLFSLSNDGRLPSSLADINLDGYLDPWGNPYQYLNITETKGNGKKRKDKNLVPINSDFDLYSSGPDGKSVGPLTAKASHDDIIRANNGKFIGVALDY